MNPQIKQIIVKYLCHSASMEELEVLENYINTPEGKIRFKQYVKTSYLVNYHMNDLDTAQELEVLLKRIRKDKALGNRLRLKPYMKYAAAAVLVGILLVGYFTKEYFVEDAQKVQMPVIVDNAIQPGSDKSILTLEDGTEVVLDKGSNYQSKNADSNGEEIFYSNSSSNSGEMAYNTLTVPRGGQFSLTLADGTKVWLNSDTQLKYPVAFQSGEPRSIELIYGEAYFDVSPSTAHQGAGFEVVHTEQTVKVLGTQFNVKAYSDETVISTTLVEGKVTLGYLENTQTLLPNQQFRYNFQDHSTAVFTVNVFDVVSWKDGVFSFDHASLEEIMKVLERWYDMEVTFEGDGLKDVEYSGSINKRFEITDILSALMETNTIKTYEINKKTIVLK